MNALSEQFILEARELIQQAIGDLIAMERDGFAAERIERVFRAFHTLKGSAGMVGLPEMNLTLHAAEDLLTAIRARQVTATARIVDAALACLDQVSLWVDRFETGEALPPRAGEDARAMAERLRAFLSAPEFSERENSERGRVAKADGELPGWISELTQSQRAAILRGLHADAGTLFAVSYEPRADCFFNGDDPLQSMRKMSNLLALRLETREPWPPPQDFDPYACNLRLHGLSAGTRAELSEIFRLVPDQIRIAEISPAALRREIEGDDETRLVRSVIEAQRHLLAAAQSGEDFIGRTGSASRAAANALRYLARDDLALRVDQAGKTAAIQRNASPLLSVLDEVLDALASAASAENTESADTGSEGTTRAAGRFLRVDETKIDALGNLSAELIVLKNAFSYLAKRVEGELGNPELARAVRREHDAMERLTGEMHMAILQLRMVPISQIFQSFPRLVRDMSQRLNKRVALVTQGETAESDKTIVDRLFEPLLHLVRNALDHGIETPQQRRAAAKPELATIEMRASRSGDRLIVEIADDGRGIDPVLVRAKAAERGLLPTEELAALSDDQIVDLIFSAGFSTAAEVSDISGRGVGMDVVRTTIEQMGGRVSLDSHVGTGTTVRLDLPTTIAMAHIMVVEAGGQLFGIPMDGVMETVRLDPDRLSQIKNNLGFVLRGRVLPICPLAALMNLPERPVPKGAVRILVVTEISGHTLALEVDAVRDRLEVVLKPLQGLLANARGYAGTTVLGDGSILLVLDLKEILP